MGRLCSDQKEDRRWWLKSAELKEKMCRMTLNIYFLGPPKQVEREAQLKMLTVTREGRKNMEKYFYSPLKKEKHEENKTKMFGESAENRKQNDVVGIYQGVTVLATPFKVPVEGKNSGKTTKMCVCGWVFLFSKRWDIKIIRVVTHRTL
jgi:hypothetical protein